MSYTTFRSPAIVIAHTPRGEADRMVTLLTRDHGVITARVQSARKITSRLRYGTQFLTHGIFEYIRARETWRLIGVHETTPLNVPAHDIQHLAPLCRDITYFVQGEDSCPEIYETFFQILDDGNRENLLDRILQKRIKILHYLGYIDLDGDALDTVETLSPVMTQKYHQMILNAYQVSQM
jgi:DNA repair protein RecO